MREYKTPPSFLSSANLQHLMASITIPAEFGESSTERRNSRFIGISPKILPSIRMKQILFMYIKLYFLISEINFYSIN